MDRSEMTKEELLEEEIKRHLNYLSTASVGSEASRQIIDDLVELSKIAAEQTKLSIESEKTQNDKELEAERLKQSEEKLALETTQKELDRDEEKKKRCWETVLQGVGIGTSIAIAVMGQIFTQKQLGTILKFEQTGEYVTSMAGKSLIGSLFRKK